MNVKILITGATGKTGFHASKQLLEQGYQVRIMTRKEGARTDELKALGAEIVTANFLDIFSLEKAFKGINRVYFVYPFVPDLLEAANNMAVVAKNSGVELFVNMSQLISQKGHGSPATRQHWLSENIFDWANIGAVHLYPGLFLDNLLAIAAPSIKADGKIYLPWGDGRHAGVSSEDIGRVITTLLSSENPNEHIGKKYRITGSVSRNMHEVAAIIGNILGREIQYIPISDEQWLEGIKQIPPLNNSQFLGHAPELSRDIRDQKFDIVTNVVEQIGGKKPITLEDFLEVNAEHFQVEVSDDQHTLQSSN